MSNAAKIVSGGFHSAELKSSKMTTREKDEALLELESAKYWYEFACENPSRKDEAMNNCMECLEVVQEYIARTY